MRFPAGLVALGLLTSGAAHGVALSEGFDDIGSLPGKGWLQNNLSNPSGITGWFQGNTGIFPAHSGAANSYIAANFENTGVGGAISNWLITPQIAFSGAMANTLQFALRGNPSGAFPDAIEVYYSTSGTSVGVDQNSTGDFSLIQRFEFLNDPGNWTIFDLAIGPQANPGYYAFRYVVADTNVAGDYIGIDSVLIGDSTDLPEPASVALIALGLAGLARVRRRR